jgi:hypothetical protein
MERMMLLTAKGGLASAGSVMSPSPKLSSDPKEFTDAQRNFALIRRKIGRKAGKGRVDEKSFAVSRKPAPASRTLSMGKEVCALPAFSA